VLDTEVHFTSTKGLRPPAFLGHGHSARSADLGATDNARKPMITRFPRACDQDLPGDRAAFAAELGPEKTFIEFATFDLKQSLVPASYQ
jgi:hypothetical protein